MATPATGLTSFFGTGKEINYGTAVARTHYMPFRSESLQVTDPPLESETVQEIGRRGERIVQGPIGVAGDIVLEAQSQGIGRFLEYVLGKVSTISPDPTNAASARRHTFEVADELPTSLTVEVFRGSGAAGFGTGRNQSFIYSGCQINQVQLEQAVNGMLIMTVSLFGREVVAQAKSEPGAFNTSPLLRFNQATLTWGGTSTNVSNVTLIVNNNLGDDRRFIGSRFRDRAVRNNFLEVRGTFTAEFDSTDLYTDFRNATQRQLIVDWVGPNIGGSITHELKATVPVGQIVEGAQPVIGGAGRVTVNIGFRAYRDASNKEIKIEVTNTSASSD